MIWIVISIAISITLNILLFPIIGWFVLIPIIGVFLGISYYMRRRQMARMGMGGGGFGGMRRRRAASTISAYPGQRFKGGSCPRCGLKDEESRFLGNDA